MLQPITGTRRGVHDVATGQPRRPHRVVVEPSGGATGGQDTESNASTRIGEHAGGGDHVVESSADADLRDHA